METDGCPVVSLHTSRLAPLLRPSAFNPLRADKRLSRGENKREWDHRHAEMPKLLETERRIKQWGPAVVVCVCLSDTAGFVSYSNYAFYHSEIKRKARSNSLHTHTHTYLKTIGRASVCENPSGQWRLRETRGGIIPVIYPESRRVVGEKRRCLPRSLLSPPESLPSNQALAWWLDQRTSGCYSYRKLPFPLTPRFFLCCVSLSSSCLSFFFRFTLLPFSHYVFLSVLLFPCWQRTEWRNSRLMLLTQRLSDGG